MDAEIFAKSMEYERLTGAVYEAVVRSEGSDIPVEHNAHPVGRSGVAHQVDVLWRHSLGGVEHTVLVECKNYASPLTLEKVRSFYGVLADVGNCQGIMVTKIGYQPGVVRFAKHYGINLKLLRPPTDADWDGRIRSISINATAVAVTSSPDQPTTVEPVLEFRDDQQRARVAQLASSSPLMGEEDADLVLWDEHGVAATDELRWWLPRQLDILGKSSGGPYTETVPLDDKFLMLAPGTAQQELVKVSALTVTYYVSAKNLGVATIDGDKIVDAILKDFESGDIEHFHRSGSA